MLTKPAIETTEASKDVPLPTQDQFLEYKTLMCFGGPLDQLEWTEKLFPADGAFCVVANNHAGDLIVAKYKIVGIRGGYAAMFQGVENRGH